MTSAANLNRLLVAVFVGLRYWHAWSVGQVKLEVDSAVFFQMAAQPFLAQEFWAGLRPFFVPLWYKFLGSDPCLIVSSQILFSVLAWSWLALSVSKIFSSKLARTFSLLFILGLALSSNIVRWDFVLLSESLGLSMSVALLAGGINLFRQTNRLNTIKFGMLLVAWSGTRETYAWLLLPIGAAVFTIAILYRFRPRLCTGLALGCLGLFFVQQVSSNLGERWKFPLLNVFGKRILIDAPMRQYFIDHGMPLNSALERRAGKWASSEDYAFYKDPDLSSFRAWLDRSGKKTYAKYLISHPDYLFGKPFQRWRTLVSPHIKRYQPKSFFSILPVWLEQLFYPTQFNNRLIYILAGIFCLSLIMSSSAPHAGWNWCLVLLTLGVMQMLLVWHGDAMEVERHSITVALQFRLLFWLTLASLIESALLISNRGRSISVN